MTKEYSLKVREELSASMIDKLDCLYEGYYQEYHLENEE